MKNLIRDILTDLRAGRISLAAAREALDTPAAVRTAEPAVYGDAWIEVPRPARHQAAAPLVVLDDDPVRRAAFSRAYRGPQIVAAAISDPRPADELLGTAGALDIVIAPPVATGPSDSALAAQPGDLLFALVEIIQRVTRTERTCRIVVVLPDVPLAPMVQRALGALARTIESEHPTCVLSAAIVAAPGASDLRGDLRGDLMTDLMADLLAELTTRDVEVELRDGRRRVRTLEPHPRAPAVPVELDGRVVLLSGGMGGLGRLLASDLAGRGARVALVGRHLDPTLVDRQRLHGFVCDLRRRDDVLRTADAIRRELGAIHLVVHAATALQDGLLRGVTRAQLDLALGAKLFGALHLAEATQGDPLSHFVAFSSLAGVLGHLGQDTYAMANALLDGWIQSRGADPRGTHFLSLAWPAWQADGLQMQGDAAARARRLGFAPMAPDVGLALFHAALGTPGRARAIAYGELSKLTPHLRRLGAEPAATATAMPARDRTSAPAQTPGATPESTASVELRIAEVMIARLGLAPSDVRADKAFDAYGVDSIAAVDMVGDLEQDFGRLPRTLFFEHKTVRELAAHLVTRGAPQRGGITTEARPAPRPTNPSPDAAPPAPRPMRPPPAPAPPAPCAPAAPRVELAAPPDADAPIAIIGIAGRYPGSPDLATFFANLRAGRDLVTEVPADRFSSPVTLASGRVARGGFLADIARFDARFFGLSGREAERIDPQERLFLEVAWEALENAAITRRAIAQLEGSVGVFVGAMFGHYQLVGAETLGTAHPTPTDSSFASIANRVSYVLDLMGPSLAIDTMCSSSLTAIHLAAAALRRGECRMALAGGVNVMSHPSKYVLLEQAHFLSSEGLCRAFGRGGDGYVPGEGVGVVVLKPLAEALRDGDRLLGVLRGSALNHGGRTNHYTVPSPTAQAKVIRDALARAGVQPDQIGYVEAHGTGTSLGDPIEVRGLTLAFAGAAHATCALGSVKSNIGHLESAAGIAGLTKVLLQLQHDTLVPTLHAADENPLLELPATPFRLAHHATPWHRLGDAPRRACLSSFGAGGSNAHLIIEEAPAQPRLRVVDDDRPRPFLLSARTDAALVRVIERAIVRCQDDALALADIAHTLAAGREHFERRVGFIAGSRSELLAALRAWRPQPATGAAPAHDDTRSLADLARAAERAGDPASARRYLEELVDAYVRGSTTAIDDIVRDGRRIEWPGYPLLGERHWVATPARAAALAAPTTSAAPATSAISASPATSAAPAMPARAEGTDDVVHELVPTWTRAVGTPAGQRRRVVVIEAAPRVSRLLASQHDVVPPAPDAATELAVVRLSLPADDSADAVQGVLGQIEANLDRWPSIARWLVVAVAPAASRRRWIGALSSFARVVQRERSRQLVVVELDEPGRFEALASLVAAFGPDHGWGTVVRVEDGARWTLHLTPRAPHAPREHVVLPRGGHVLLTGGLGGIGLHVASWLRERFDARVVMLGRSAPRPEALTRLAALGAGAQVRYVQCDVAERAALAAVLAAERARTGPLAGVFHAAGVQRDGLLATLDATARAAVLAPKLDGTRWLDELTADDDLTCFVLFGSLAAHLGGVGQSIYAAANGYLAGFAAERGDAVRAGQRRGTTLCIDWPLWEEGGMRPDPGTERALEERFGLRPLATAAGLAALERLLASGDPEVAVIASRPGQAEATLDPRLEALLAGSAGASPPPAAPAIMRSAGPATPRVQRHERDLIAALLGHASAYLKIPPHELAPTTRFSDMGLDSIGLKELARVLSDELAIAIAPGAFFEFPDAEAFARGLAAAPASPAPRPTSPAPSPALRDNDGAIAIIGAAGRFPGSDDLDAFFRHLRDGHDLIRDVPADRWNADDFPTLPRQGGYLDDVRGFDADYFRMSPTEAALLDPQHRLFLEAVIHAIEDAAIAPRTLAGRSVGVFAGVQFDDYKALVAASGVMHPFAATGNAHAMLPNRVSHWLDVHGPSEAVDTACSSALVAVARAIDALRTGRCELAVAGGVSLVLSPATVAVTQAMGILSPDARCHVLSARANGYVKGEGVGVIVLKPLARARADGDPVRAVIRAAGVNHGGRAKSLTAPNPRAQAALLKMTHDTSGGDPASLGYLELHGTGTELGDPIEVEAIRTALGNGDPDGPPCWIGSVKSNIGHLEPAAGIAGLLKAMLAIEHGEIPPSLHASPPNPYLALDGTRYRVADALVPWPRAQDDRGEPRLRRAGVSSFGFGGTNAHVVLEEAPASPPPHERAAGPAIVALSAKSAEALASRAAELRRFLGTHPDAAIADVATTLAAGRDHEDVRAAIVAATREELDGALEALAGGARHPRLISGSARDASPALDELHARLPHELAATSGEVHLRKLLAIADLYTRGYAIPKLLRSGRRIHLPGYPFARTPHWVDAPTPPPDTTSSAAASRAAVPASRAHATTSRPTVPEAGLPELVVATPVWHEVAAPPPAPRRPGRALVIHAPEHGELARALANQLPGGEVRLVDQLDQVTLDSAVLHARAPARIVFLAGVTPTPLVELSAAALARSQQHGVHALFHLVKALHRYGLEGEPLELAVLVNDVEGASASTAIAAASLVGFVGSLAKEHPAWSVACVDVPWSELVDPGERAARLKGFLDEPADPAGSLTRLSGRLRLRHAWQRLETIAPEAHPAYGPTFVLGGRGGLGLAFAEHIARHEIARIALVGRGAPSEHAQRAIARLRRDGHTILSLHADGRDRDQLAGALAQATDELGALDTVVHSTLVLKDRTLRTMDPATLEDVLAAKTLTGVAVVEACRARPPKQLVFFSSAQATRADAGQANYAAGSTFIDALARAAGLVLPATRVVTVDWGYWGSVGVVANDVVRDRLARLGIGSIEPAHGFAALDRLVAAGVPRALVVRAAAAAHGALGIESAAPDVQTTWEPAPRLPALVHALPDAIRRFEAGTADAHDAHDALGAFARAALAQALGTTAQALRDPDALRDRLGVAPAYHRLWVYCASTLAAAPAPALTRAALLSKFPSLAPHVALLEATLPHLTDVLAERRDPASVLFPDGSADLVERVYAGNPVVDHGGAAVASMARALVAARASRRPVALLEVGAGTGGTTRHVLEALPEELPWTYRCTDISRTLLERTRSRFARRDGRVVFERLDIEAPPGPDLEGTADIVIATNVLHATRSLAVTLSHVARLLRPSGVLLLQEVTADHEFATLTFGLTRAWWEHDDVALRLPGGPLARPATWRALLEASGFRAVVDVTQDHPALGGQRVFAAERGFETRPAARAPARPERTAGAPASGPATDPRGTLPPTGAARPANDRRSEVVQAIVTTLAEATRFPRDRFAVDRPFVDLGIDSLIAVDVIARINRALGTSLRATDLYNFGHVNALAEHILRGPVTLPSRPQAPPAPEPVRPPAARAPWPDPPRDERPDPRRGDAAIAIIGISGRFAQANSVDELARALDEGRLLIGPRPAARSAAGDADRAPYPGGYLDEVARFDARFFQLSGREALLMDPQQRLLLEESWKAIEHAGYPVAELAGRACGVFVGAFPGDYGELLRQRDDARREAYLLTGNSDAMLAGRIAYALDLHGPAVTLDTACSSSLVALHLACESLRAGTCEVALVGGVTLFSTPRFHELAATAGMLSADGRCYTFDARGNGFVPAEAIAVAMLKPLDRALGDGDHVLGVVLGSEINQDGRTNGITAPSATSQAALIRRAHQRAGVTSETIDYVEAHGTGTRLGDPIEVSALLDAFGRTPRPRPCVLGAVKANVGHALPASGLVSLAKVLGAFAAEYIPGQPEFDQENPLLELPPATFAIPRTRVAWPRTPEAPRRAGISAFGFSGTNAHVVLEEAPVRAPAPAPASAGVLELFVSARTPTALAQRLRDLGHVVASRDDLALADLCFTANRGRDHFEHRVAFVFRSRGELAQLFARACAAPAAEGQVYAGDGLDPERQNADRYVEHAPCQLDRVTGRRIPLPTYPFEGERYWVESRRPTAAVLAGAGALIARGAALRALEAPFAALEVGARRALAATLATMAVLDQRARPVDQILDDAQIAPAHHRLVGFLIETLVRAGLAARSEAGIRLAGAPIPLAQARHELAALDNQHPVVRPHRALLSTCLDAYPEVLRGTADPVGVLFPAGSTQLVEAIYRGNAVVDHHNALVAAFVRIAAQRPACRVLEIGAGTGGTTAAVLHELDDAGVPGGFEYVYTDISSHFLRHGERAFARGRDYLRFARLDIETAPASQGFAPGSFDAVLATNVLHATRNIATTLHHVRQLLRPGGLVIVNELVRREDYATITFGLTKGWWAYEDHEHRIPGTPLLAANTWTRLLEAAGFEDVQIASPLASAQLAAAVLVAAVPTVAPATAPSAPRPEPAPPRPEPAPLASPPPAPATTSTATRAFVLARLAEALMIPASQIADDTPFASLGVDSLVSTQVLALLSERFGPLPPHLLLERPTLAELTADLATRGPGAPRRVEASGAGPDEVMFRRARRFTESEPRHDLVSLDDQHALDLYSFGAGAPLVLLPPLNTHPVVWLAQIEAFAADRRIVIPSYPGHGRSAFSSARASFTDWTRQLVQALERAGVTGRFDVVGWSLGGCFGQLLASAHPSIVRSLTLVSTAMQFTEAYRSRAPDIAEELTTHREALGDLFGRDVDAASLLPGGASRAALAAYQAALAGFDTRDAMRRISASTLILVGSRDAVLAPEHGRALGDAIPAARLVELDRAGHFLPLTAAAQTNRLLIRHLATPRDELANALFPFAESR